MTVLLELDHVTKKFGSVVVADELSLAARTGQASGLWGLVADRLNIRIFPVRYWLWPAGEGRRKRLTRGRHSGG